MSRQNEAAALAGARGESDMGSAGAEYCPPEDRANQRAIILSHLRRHGSISTIEARLQHHIMSPAARVLELKRQGHIILTERDPRQKCARYHLQVNGDQGGVNRAIE
jgi:hypothetical protein